MAVPPEIVRGRAYFRTYDGRTTHRRGSDRFRGASLPLRRAAVGCDASRARPEFDPVLAAGEPDPRLPGPDRCPTPDVVADREASRRATPRGREASLTSALGRLTLFLDRLRTARLPFARCALSSSAWRLPSSWPAAARPATRRGPHQPWLSRARRSLGSFPICRQRAATSSPVTLPRSWTPRRVQPMSECSSCLMTPPHSMRGSNLRGGVAWVRSQMLAFVRSSQTAEAAPLSVFPR